MCRKEETELIQSQMRNPNGPPAREEGDTILDRWDREEDQASARERRLYPGGPIQPQLVNGKWEAIVCVRRNLPVDEVMGWILVELYLSGETTSAGEFSKRFGLNDVVVDAALYELRKDGALHHDGRGRYRHLSHHMQEIERHVASLPIEIDHHRRELQALRPQRDRGFTPEIVDES